MNTDRNQIPRMLLLHVFQRHSITTIKHIPDAYAWRFDFVSGFMRTA